MIEIHRTSPIFDSKKVRAIRKKLKHKAKQNAFSVSVELPSVDDDWQIGLIVGPSGSGKTSVVHEAYGDCVYEDSGWPKNKAVVDGFGDVKVKDVAMTLTAVGFSSPPSWIKPFHVLSNGEQFRCNLARALLTGGELVAYDEFTSVVDRQVAKVGSAAVSKSIRKGLIDRRFVAATCHYDIADWLQPDWVLDMQTGVVSAPTNPRPPIELEICRCDRSAWKKTFSKHHYLTAEINHCAACYVGLVNSQPVAFSAWLPFVGRFRKRPGTTGNAYRGHRDVVLPSFQGVGMGKMMFETIASAYAGLGHTVFSCTAHPAEIHSRQRSPNWKMHRKPSRTPRDGCKTYDKKRAVGRLTAGFEYTGPKMDKELAKEFVTKR